MFSVNIIKNREDMKMNFTNNCSIQEKKSVPVATDGAGYEAVAPLTASLARNGCYVVAGKVCSCPSPAPEELVKLYWDPKAADHCSRCFAVKKEEFCDHCEVSICYFCEKECGGCILRFTEDPDLVVSLARRNPCFGSKDVKFMQNYFLSEWGFIPDPRARQ